MSGVLATFLVLAVELDGGLVALADRRITLGADVCHPAVIEFGVISDDGLDVSLEKQGLPVWARDSWWINRAAMVLECVAGDESIYDGTVRFDGIIDAQPSETAGVWSLALVPPKRRVRQVPDYGLITAADWPLASDAAMGAQKPMVVGAVEYCPLLPVQVQPWTTLTVPALPDTHQLDVADSSTLAASGSVVVDGITYAYTYKDANLLLGMTVTRSHAAGTLVSQAGANVYLAAGHAVSAITDVRAGDTRIDGGVVDLAAATVTFASPPAVVASATRYTLDEHFDAIHASNTASNPSNAIRAALNSYTQSGTPSGTVTAALPGTISFSRPSDGNRIISGAYSVQFSVAVAAQIGWARVKIGNDVVWSYDPGVGVLYNWSPCAITLDDDADVLPVSVEVESGGSPDQVTVTIVTASRVVVTGNLDEANYSTVAPGQRLVVTQSDTPPDRGRIAKARLVVRWFSTDAALGTTSVMFGGATLGKLALTANSGASINKTVAVNSVTQGAASFPSTAVSTSATKTDSSVSVAINYPISYTVAEVNVSRFIFLHPIDVYVGLPLGVVSGTYTFTLYLNPQGTAGLSAQSYYEVGGNVQSLYTATPPSSISFSVALSANQANVRVRHYQVGGRYPYDWIAATMHATISSVSAAVTTTPTAQAVAVSAASQALSAASLTNTGIAVSLTNNQIELTVPAPPRVVNTAFDLPAYTDWSHFAGKSAEISLTGTGASLCIVETYLQVEFDEIAHAVAEGITASVTGIDGNPAAVIAVLAAASDEQVAVQPLARLSDWCDANALAFARRLADQDDALTLLHYAAEQCGVLLARTPAGLAPVRWLDLYGSITAITDDELLEPAKIAWSDRVENHVTLHYADDYATGNGFARVAQATDANDNACALSVTAMGETRAVEIEGGWLRADAAAAVSLAQHVARYASPRRVAALDLPFSVELEQGSLIEYSDAVWRVTAIASDNGWLSVSAEELVL